MKLYESLYYSLIVPKKIIGTPLKINHAIVIYIIACISMSISVIYLSENRADIFSLFIIIAGFSGYIALGNLLKIAIIHTMASITIGYRNGRDIKTFISNCFSVSAVFIFTFPIVLIVKRLPSIVNGIFFLVTLIFTIYYIILLYRVVKYSFNVKSVIGGIGLLIVPVIYDCINFIFFIIFISGVMANIISSIL